MQKLDGINQICGGYWRKGKEIYENMYSVLMHSVGVALIIWNFTQDKKQTIEKMYKQNFITKDDLYKLSERKIIDLIENCSNKEISNSFRNFMNCNSFVDCEVYKTDKFCVDRKVKRRYINPITNKGRVYDISSFAKEKIDGYINMPISRFAYMDI